MARPKKTNRQVKQTQEAILLAAATVFSERGYGSASMQAIAAEAGFSAPTLYAYFDGKAAILAGLHELLRGEIAGLFTIAMPTSLSLEQRVELLLLNHAQWVAQRRDVFVFLSRSDVPAEMRPGGNPEKGMEVTEMFAAWFERYAKDDELGGHTPRIAAIFLTGLSHGFFLDWLRRGATDDLHTLMRLCSDLFFNGISKAAVDANEPTNEERR